MGENSIIVVASRQVRMHDCKNVDIYLHCGSRPIIEDCSNVRFSPIPECYRRFKKRQSRVSGTRLMISSGSRQITVQIGASCPMTRSLTRRFGQMLFQVAPELDSRTS